MDGAGGGDDAGAFDGVVALVIGDSAAGAFDDGDESHFIPEVHDWVDHNISEAGREEIVAVAVAPISIEFNLFEQGVKIFYILKFFDIEIIGSK